MSTAILAQTVDYDISLNYIGFENERDENLGEDIDSHMPPDFVAVMLQGNCSKDTMRVGDADDLDLQVLPLLNKGEGNCLPPLPYNNLLPSFSFVVATGLFQ